MVFTGRAVYDNYSVEQGEDVSDVVSMISPKVTPVLDLLGDGDESAGSMLHTWIEEALNAETYLTSSAIASTAAASGGLEIAGAGQIRVNDIFQNDSEAGREQLLVTSLGTSAATIYVTRAYAGTVANSSAAGGTLRFLGNAVLEGSGVGTERAVDDVLASNYVQTFREDISVSMIRENANTRPAGQPSKFEKEKLKRIKEQMRALESSLLMGRTNGNTIGSASAQATMAGIYNSIATNIVSHGTYSNSLLGNLLASVNNNTDVAGDDYVLIAGVTAKRLIDNLNNASMSLTNDAADVYKRNVKSIETTFGAMPIVMSSRIPTGSILALKKELVRIVPYKDQSFQVREYDNGTHARQGYVIGSYTVEFASEKAHGRIDGVAA